MAWNYHRNEADDDYDDYDESDDDYYGNYFSIGHGFIRWAVLEVTLARELFPVQNTRLKISNYNGHHDFNDTQLRIDYGHDYHDLHDVG